MGGELPQSRVSGDSRSEIVLGPRSYGVIEHRMSSVSLETRLRCGSRRKLATCAWRGGSSHELRGQSTLSRHGPMWMFVSFNHLWLVGTCSL